MQAHGLIRMYCAICWIKKMETECVSLTQCQHLFERVYAERYGPFRRAVSVLVGGEERSF